MSSASRIALRYAGTPFLIVATAILIGWSFAPPIGLYDEGFSLTNAARLLHGDVPYRDYWTAYPPATAMTLAAAFRIFEPTLAVARAVNAAWSLLLVLSIYALLARLQSRLVAAVAALIAAYWIACGLYPSYSVTPPP